ncbi:MAG: uroporphyrinogen-III synthase [Hyphomicrobiales bacterium]|nr:uroporphyrinogen-III synthase [Hyphomicrobiales bacterium]
MRVLLTRPREDSEPLARTLVGLGHAVLIAPLMRIVPCKEVDLNLDGVQALLATSSNGVRALAAQQLGARSRRLPLFAVGDATARTARKAGFSDVRVAGGDVDALAALVRDSVEPERGRIVHIAGRDRAGDLKAALRADGFTVEVAVLYAAKAATALSQEARSALRAGELDAVLLYSPRTARIHADLIRAETEDLLAAARSLYHVCLSQAVATELAPLGLDRGRLLVATAPRQEALLQRLAEAERAGNASR